LRGLAPLDPDPAADPASDFLRLLHGRDPRPAEAGALDAYLVTVADHGMNASTFAARVVASTRAGLVSSVIAGLCALKGPLHGGAPGPVLDMLDAIGTPDNIEPWLRGALDRGERLMGFGHRIYRTRDPRADVLKAALHRLAQARGGDVGRLAFAESVERTALRLLQEKQPERRLDTNVEFYTALLLDAIGIPRDLFTPVFAMGRVLGWIAHVWEQEQSGRLIRPQSHYTGPLPAGMRAA
jgi:citrate synthase